MRSVYCTTITIIFLLLLVACSGKGEKQEADLNYAVNYLNNLQAYNQKQSVAIAESMPDCFHHGFSAAFLIERYNNINTFTDSALKQLNTFQKTGNFLPQAVDSIKRKVIEKMKKELEILATQQVKYIAPDDKEELEKTFVSVLENKELLSPKLGIIITTLDLLMTKNKFNTVLSRSCGNVDLHCFWTPFANSLVIKNYESNNVSYLEVKFPSDNKNTFRELKMSATNDTIPVSVLKIKSVLTSYKINLSGLKAGKYQMLAVAKLFKPDGTSPEPEYTKQIEFEVFH